MIPSSVTTISEFAFRGCTNLRIFTPLASQPTNWHTNWNPNNRPVFWAYSPDFEPRNLTFTLSEQDVTLNWAQPFTLGPGFSGYRVYRGNELLTPTILTALTYTATNTPVGTHVFSVVATFQATLESYPRQVTVEVLETVPGQVTLLTPLNHATNVPINQTLTWQVAGTVTGYRVYIGTPTFPTEPTATVSTASYSPTLEQDSIYQWRVVAFNEIGDGESSATWSFQTLAFPTIEVSAIGLSDLKVNQEVSEANVYYTLSNGVYATPIIPAHFSVANLPIGLLAGQAERTSDTVITIAITGTPTLHNPEEINLITTPIIPATNVVEATASIEVTGAAVVGIVEKGDGAEVSGVPTENSVTTNSITVNALTIPTNPGSQTVEYAIYEFASPIPTTGWQYSTTFTELESSTMYFVFARAAENENYNAGETQRSVAIRTLTALPGQVILVSPENHATNKTVRPTLVWQQPEGFTVGYYVYKATSVYPYHTANPELNRVAVILGAANTNWVTGTDLVGDETYHWQVVAFNETGLGEESASWSFTVGTVSCDDTVDMVMVTGIVGNFPNPFNPSTIIQFSIGNVGNVKFPSKLEG